MTTIASPAPDFGSPEWSARELSKQRRELEPFALYSEDERRKLRGSVGRDYLDKPSAKQTPEVVIDWLGMCADLYAVSRTPERAERIAYYINTPGNLHIRGIGLEPAHYLSAYRALDEILRGCLARGKRPVVEFGRASFPAELRKHLERQGGLDVYESLMGTLDQLNLISF